jgi:hypothetical protein
MKKKYYVMLGILALFIITNPSITAFKAYRGSNSYEGLQRPLNFFVFSVYKEGGTPYIGVFGNFVRVQPHRKVHGREVVPMEVDNKDTLVKVDTTVVGHTSDGLPIFKQ